MVFFFKSGAWKENSIRIIFFYCASLFTVLLAYDFIPLDLVWMHQITITFLEFLFFSLFFFFSLKNKILKKIILAIIPLFLCFQILYSIYGPVVRFDAVPSGIEAILILAYIIFFFFEEMSHVNTKLFFYQNFSFWICFGIMFYLAGTFFFFIMANSGTMKQVKEYWFLTYIIEIIKNLLITYAVFVFAQTYRHLTSKKELPNLDFTL